MDPSHAMHAYEKLPLFGTGVVLGLWLVGIHLLMLVKAEAAKEFLNKFPRNQQLGQILLGVGLIWFWLLVQPTGKGALNFLAMELGDFDKLKPLLRIAVPVSIFLVAISVKEFLAVRALGLLGLMVAAPLLGAAYLEDPTSRLLIPIFAYALIIKSLYWVGMPYIFRDTAKWATANQGRWRVLCLGGLAYGVATLACAFLFWRGL